MPRRYHGKNECQPSNCCANKNEDIPFLAKIWTSSLIVINFIIVITSIIGASYKFNKYNPWFGTIPDTVYKCFKVNLILSTISIAMLSIFLILLKDNWHYRCSKFLLTFGQIFVFLALIISSSIGTDYLNTKMFPYYTFYSGSSNSNSGKFQEICKRYYSEVWPEELNTLYNDPSIIDNIETQTQEIQNAFLIGKKLEKKFYCSGICNKRDSFLFINPLIGRPVTDCCYYKVRTEAVKVQCLIIIPPILIAVINLIYFFVVQCCFQSWILDIPKNQVQKLPYNNIQPVNSQDKELQTVIDGQKKDITELQNKYKRLENENQNLKNDLNKNHLLMEKVMIVNSKPQQEECKLKKLEDKYNQQEIILNQIVAQINMNQVLGNQSNQINLQPQIQQQQLQQQPIALINFDNQQNNEVTYLIQGSK